MKPRIVIDPKHFPARYPIVSTAVAWLLMDRLEAGDLARGIVWTLFALLWIVAVYCVATQEKVSLWDDADEPAKAKSKWQQRIEEIQQKQASKQ